MIKSNNDLINSFFDDKIRLNFDIEIFRFDKKDVLNFDLMFKKKITSFDFEKILNYVRIDISDEINYKKVTDYYDSIFESIKVDDVDYSETLFTLSEIQTVLVLLFQKVKEEIAKLKKK